MKKGIVVLCTLFLFISLYAQESYFKPTQSEGLREGKSNFHGGVRLGFTGSQITKDGFPFEGYNKFGAFAGGFVNFPITRNGKWFIQPELNFIMKGCKHLPQTDESGNMSGDKYVLQLMYGEIPVVGKWKFYKGFELEAGPAFGVLFKNYEVEKVNDILQIGAPLFSRFEFAGLLGISYLFFNHIGLSLRYEVSFLPVRKYSAFHFMYLLVGQHNQSFCFSVYYQF